MTRTEPPPGTYRDPWPVDLAAHLAAHATPYTGPSVLSLSARDVNGALRRLGFRVRCRRSTGHCWHLRPSRVHWACCECPADRQTCPPADARCRLCPSYGVAP